MLAHELDGRSVVLVADTFNHNVVAVGEDGSWVRSVGSKGSEDGQFHVPAGLLRLPAGEVVVADHHNKRLVVLSGADLSFVRAVGMGFKAIGVAADERTGRVFVADVDTHAVHEVDMGSGRSLRKVGGGGRAVGTGSSTTRRVWPWTRGASG